MDSRAKAVALAAQGFRLFRVNSQTHRPSKSGWPSTASADPAVVEREFTDAVGDSVEDNPAIATGQGLLVVDIDVKGNKGGAASLMDLVAEGLPTDTRTVRTPSGGLHFYYRVDDARGFANRQGWREGVDVRGFNGFVFAPGAVKSGREYVVELDLPIADLPSNFADELSRARSSRFDGEIPPAPGVEPDSDVFIDRVAHWLEYEAEIAVEGQGGHKTLLTVAHTCMDMGVTPQKAVELMAGYWDFRCEPEWGDEAIERQVLSLAKSRKDRIGCSAPEARPTLADIFEPIEGAPEPTAGDDDFRLIFGHELKQQPPDRQWLVKDLVADRTVSILAGDGGVGKSLLALQLAAACATGRNWLGVETKPGPVLFVSAEDETDEINRRMLDIAKAEGFGLDDLHRFAVVPRAGLDAVMGAPDANGRIRPTKLWRKLETAVARMKPALVVLDTLADVFSGSEIVRPEVRQFVGQVRGLALEHGCAALILAHPSLAGLNSGSGTSGSTAWSNSVRSRLYLRRPKDAAEQQREPNVRVLETMKQNYAAGVGDERRLRWEAGRFVVQTERVVAEDELDPLFLAMLAEAVAAGRSLSDKRSPSYAPAVMARHPNAAGYSKEDFEAAMERLFVAGKIKMEANKRGSGRMIICE